MAWTLLYTTQLQVVYSVVSSFYVCLGLSSFYILGKYKSKDIIPDEGRYSNTAGVVGVRYRERYFKDSVFEALKIIEPVVERHGLTMVETALRWVIHHSALSIVDGNDGVIIGCSSLAQLDENLKDCEKGPLPAEVIEALDKAWLVSKVDTPNYFRFDFSKLSFRNHSTN